MCRYMDEVDLNKVNTEGKLHIGDFDENFRNVSLIEIHNLSYTSASQHVYIQALAVDGNPFFSIVSQSKLIRLQSKHHFR